MGWFLKFLKLRIGSCILKVDLHICITSKLSITIMNEDKNGSIGPIPYILLPKIHVLYIQICIEL